MISVLMGCTVVYTNVLPKRELNLICSGYPAWNTALVLGGDLGVAVSCFRLDPAVVVWLWAGLCPWDGFLTI